MSGQSSRFPDERRARALGWIRERVGPHYRVSDRDIDRFLSWFDQDVRPWMSRKERVRLAEATLATIRKLHQDHDANRAASLAGGGSEHDRAAKAGIRLVQGGSAGLGKRGGSR